MVILHFSMHLAEAQATFSKPVGEIIGREHNSGPSSVVDEVWYWRTKPCGNWCFKGHLCCSRRTAHNRENCREYRPTHGMYAFLPCMKSSFSVANANGCYEG